MKKAICWMAATALLSGCAASQPPATPAAPRGTMLAYAAPAPVTVAYQFSDSSGFVIEGGAIGMIRVSVRTSGVIEATHTAKGPDVEVRLKMVDFDGSFANSATGTTTHATETDVQGEAVLTVTPQGVLTINQLPTTTRQAQAVGVASGFFRRFTVRLPRGAAQRGAVWTDTVTATEETGGTRSSVTDVVTATWARDTVLNGRTLHVITHNTRRTLDVSGTSEGVEIAQKLTGRASGYTLWDAQRSVIAERLETTELSGSFDLPAMGLTGLPVRASGTGRITLR
jgi:hypothetical protein